MTRWGKKTDDEQVKTELVKGIKATSAKSDWGSLAALAREYARLRYVEAKADQGDWGSELVTPAASDDAAQVRS